ncbi:hypothetical protein [Alkaliphilus transvaalensis]|uniref:hypothetical protein n=1 Tax=Alkaliphilus transvaalensis TaxID=114628 RepID=UPI00047D0808|nr:hypothetical protein [Alkaliphilus transvaalensis]
MQKSKIEPVNLDVGVDYDSNEISCEDVYEHVRDINKFKKWFNCFPLIWLTSKDDTLKKGTVMIMHGGFPPIGFVFSVTITELSQHHCKAEVKEINGKFYGETSIYVERIGNITRLQKDFWVCADTQKDLDAYAIGAKKFHGKYVRWRAGLLRKIILKEKNKF